MYSSFPEIVPVYVYCPGKIINSALFHLKKNCGSNDKLYGLPVTMRQITALLSFLSLAMQSEGRMLGADAAIACL